MRKLDANEFKLCQTLGRIFEKSIGLSFLSSPMFIRRFMAYEGSKCFFDKSYLSLSSNEEDIILEINGLYGKPKNKVSYSPEQMYWIGYAYGAISFLYDLPPKSVYRLFSAKEIVGYYAIYHTFGIEEAAERMMENIGYAEQDYVSKGVAIYKRLFLLDELKTLLGKTVRVYVDEEKNSIKEEGQQIVHGYIKEIRGLDGDCQEAYVLGADGSKDEILGVVHAIIDLTNEGEYKLLVATEGSQFNEKEMGKVIFSKQRSFRHRIIR